MSLEHDNAIVAMIPRYDPQYDLSQRRGRLLVVDDQPTNIQAIHQIFAAQHDVFMATSGQQALDFCSRTPPDLVLLDVEMSGMDGLEVCRRLKQNVETRDIPVIFVTANSQAENENACWEAGGVDFVNKPVNPTTLRSRVRAHLTLKFQFDLLREMAFVDGLTGVANRRLFDERLDAEWRRCSRSQLPLSLIMIDIDYFKAYNDHYGHQTGDDCLRFVAHTLKARIRRPYDLLARYGGEEFVCLLPETDLAGATAMASILLAAVRSLTIEHHYAGAEQIVSISLGVACEGFTADTSSQRMPESLIQRADAKLYDAKRAGRGQVGA